MGMNRRNLGGGGGRIGGEDMVVEFGRKNTSFEIEIEMIGNGIRVTRKGIIFEIKAIIIMMESRRLPWRYQT